jgi:hypothetical protein
MVSVDAALAGRLQVGSNVQQLPSAGCGPTNTSGCLLTICSNLSQPITFSNSSIVGVTSESSAVVCVAGSSKVAFEGCTFEANLAAGSALVVLDTAQVQLTACTLTNNQGYQGGALRVAGKADVEFVNTTICNNIAVYGGGLFAAGSARLTLTASYLVNNLVRRVVDEACDGGGACLVESAVMVVTGSRITNNSAVCETARGGAIALWGASRLVMGEDAAGPTLTPGLDPSTFNTSGRNMVAGNTAMSNTTKGAPGQVSQARRGANTDPASSSSDSVGSIAHRAAALGGAIFAADQSTLQLTDTLLVNNTVSSPAGTVGGGAMALIFEAGASLGSGVVLEQNKAVGSVAYGAAAWVMGLGELSATGVAFKVGVHFVWASLV